MPFPELAVSEKSKANEWVQWNDCTVNQILVQLQAESGISYGLREGSENGNIQDMSEKVIFITAACVRCRYDH
jgi:hypothetical protein